MIKNHFYKNINNDFVRSEHAVKIFHLIINFNHRHFNKNVYNRRIFFLHYIVYLKVINEY